MAKQPQVKEVGAPAWVVTFTDLTSLLTTFFVLLLTFSTMDTVKVRKILSHLQGSMGVLGTEMKNQPNIFHRDYHQTRRAKTGPETPREPNKDLEEVVPRLHKGLIVTEGKLEKGIRIRFKTPFAFAPGEVTPSARLIKALKILGAELRHKDLEIIIEGYTDSRFNGDEKFSTALELSYERGVEAAKILINSGIEPWRITVKGMGKSNPIASNLEEEGRAKNRRIEIVIRKRR